MKVSATAHEVARLAKVSQSAVSRTFTTGASVSDSTRQKVLHAARTLGYRPNALARSLITRRSRIIALVMSYLENQFYPLVIERLSQRLQKQGYHVLMFISEVSDANQVLLLLDNKTHVELSGDVKSLPTTYSVKGSKDAEVLRHHESVALVIVYEPGWIGHLKWEARRMVGRDFPQSQAPEMAGGTLCLDVKRVGESGSPPECPMPCAGARPWPRSMVVCG